MCVLLTVCLQEDELQRQLAQLGASLGKLKGFTAASRQVEEVGSRSSIKRNPSNRRPRRLERTASDSESSRYDADGPEAPLSPLAAKKDEKDAPAGKSDHGETHHASGGTCAARIAKRRAAGSRGSGAIVRRATFSYGQTPAAEPDHHAIAALPPELLLKQILFDTDSEKPVPKAVRRIPRLERERKQSQ